MGIFNDTPDYEVLGNSGELPFFALTDGRTITGKWTVIKDRNFKSSFTYEYLTVWEFSLDGRPFRIQAKPRDIEDVYLKTGGREFLYLGDMLFNHDPQFYPKRSAWKSAVGNLPFKIGEMDKNAFIWQYSDTFGSELYAEYRIGFELVFDLKKKVVQPKVTLSSDAVCHVD